MNRWFSDNKRRGMAIAGGLLLLTALAFAGLLRPIVDPVSRLLVGVVSPLRRLALSAVDGAVQSGACLDSAPVAELLQENAKLKTLVAENEALKAAMAYRDREPGELVLARVVYETDGDVLHGLVIDRGSADGLAEGMPVLTDEGVLLGKVFEVHRRGATVMLLSDTHSRLAVTVQNGADTIGVLMGDRGLAMRIDLIPQTEALQVGDTVVTSGLEPGITRGLLVGVLDRVDQNDESPFQSAVVTPFAGRSRPAFVQVMTSLEGMGLGQEEPDAPDRDDAAGGN
jgi:rod shape-determining protein MreC